MAASRQRPGGAFEQAWPVPWVGEKPMPYQLIPFFASLVLGIWYVAISEASARSRITIGITILASLIIGWGYPQWFVVTTLLQVGASIYVLIDMKMGSLR
jgi:hypothetical protein